MSAERAATMLKPGQRSRSFAYSARVAATSTAKTNGAGSREATRSPIEVPTGRRLAVQASDARLRFHANPATRITKPDNAAAAISGLSTWKRSVSSQTMGEKMSAPVAPYAALSNLFGVREAQTSQPAE